MAISLRWCAVEDVDAALHDAWTALGMHAAHSNLYAMPQFVLPASRWLTPGHPPSIAIFERVGTGTREIVAVGCFSQQRPTLFAPFHHLRGYRTTHTSQTGLICLDDEAEHVADALMDHMAGASKKCHAIAFHNIPAAHPFFLALSARALEQGHRWYPLRAIERPALRRIPGTACIDRIPRKVVRDINRRRRRLQGIGALSTRLICGQDLTIDSIDRYLDIEHMGWKGTGGSSMRSSPAEAGFFREMAQRFGEIGCAAFIETHFDEEAIASLSLFRVGDTLNTFKTAYNPAFANDSPGRSNLLALVESLESGFPGVAMLDSNSQQTSFAASILPDRVTMLSGFLPTTRFGQHALKAARLIRPIAYRFDGDP